MDFDLKQWRLSQHQSEQPPALPLFVSEPNARISNLSAFQDSSITTTTSRLPRLGGVFSIAQIQELELQVLIFKYILAGADVPVELLQSIKSLININTSPAYLYHPYQQYQHYQPYVLHSGYWGRNSVDPEPGRCRRTDGKKWRCSRDVVVGQKYCERHVNRGRNRSRKPVEITTPAGLKTADSVATVGASFALSKPSSPLIDLIQLNQRSLETKMGNEIPLEAQNIEGSRPEGQLLRHFFDECPKLHKESNGVGRNASPTTSTTGLSISIPRNHSSDFSLKLSTGNADGPSSGEATVRAERSHQSWAREWATQPGNYMGGGLLTEMLRSTSNSPTSVLRELRRGCVSETSSVST